MDEVDAFLDEIIRDHEAFYRENTELKETIARMTEEAAKSREISATLEKTMVLAQRVYDEEALRAKKEADIMLWDAGKKAEALIQESQQEVLDTRQRIERLRLYEKQLYLKHKGFLEFQMELLDGYKDKEAVLNESDMEKLLNGARDRDLTGLSEDGGGTLPDVVSVAKADEESQIWEKADGQSHAEARAEEAAGIRIEPAAAADALAEAEEGTIADTEGAVEGAAAKAVDAETGTHIETAAATDAADVAAVDALAQAVAVAEAEIAAGTASAAADTAVSDVADTIASIVVDAAVTVREEGETQERVFAIVDGTQDELGAIPPEYRSDASAETVEYITNAGEADAAADAFATGAKTPEAGTHIEALNMDEGVPMAGIFLSTGAQGQAQGQAQTSEQAGGEKQEDVSGEDSPFVVKDQVTSMEQVVLLAQKMEEALKALDTMYGSDDEEDDGV